MLAAAFTFALLAQEPAQEPTQAPATPAPVVNPLQLAIGREGQTVAVPGRITNLSTGTGILPEDVAAACDGKRFLFLGEQHATTPHQMMQAAIIDACVRRGRRVVVGLEMFQRPKQNVLGAFPALAETEFLQRSEWDKQWGFDYSFYRPVFDVARKHHLPLVALNIPRDWVRTVGRGGMSALPPEAKAELPTDMVLDNAQHRQVFTSLIGGHQGTGGSIDNMYAAQVLWDEAMADTAVRFLRYPKPSANTLFVVIAGSGHVMYNQGINWRLQRRKAGDGPTVVMTESSEPITVSNGLADFVFVSPKPRG